MIRASYLAGFILVASLCSAALAGLIPCPDCGKQVSDRAVMCPSCGCPGDAIRAAAQSNQTAKIELPSFCHSLVRVTSDQGEGAGVCIQTPSQLYVLTAQNLMAGAQSLALTKMLDGQSIAYTSIELAADRNLARLAVNATNLHPLAMADTNSADLALVYVATNGTVAVMQTGAVSGQLPVGTPLLDAATNLVMVIGTSDGKHAETVASVPAWVPVQPLTYRTQTTLLQKAGKRTGDYPAVLQQLQETKWLTPYLAQQAETLIKELQQRSGP
ncbi:MAG: zinc ribbon domain-containing protein [bacterium]